jgi:hypothetical protein
VTFEKSRAAIGVAGPWVVPLVQVDPPILRVTATTKRKGTLTAVLDATAPGNASVQAAFDQECSPGTTTPCTIPPVGFLSVGVRIVSP